MTIHLFRKQRKADERITRKHGLPGLLVDDRRDGPGPGTVTVIGIFVKRRAPWRHIRWGRVSGPGTGSFRRRHVP